MQTVSALAVICGWTIDLDQIEAIWAGPGDAVVRFRHGGDAIYLPRDWENPAPLLVEDSTPAEWLKRVWRERLLARSKNLLGASFAILGITIAKPGASSIVLE